MIKRYQMTCPHCNNTYVIRCEEHQRHVNCNHCHTIVKVRVPPPVPQIPEIENRKIDASIYRDKLAYDLKVKQMDNDFTISLFQYIGLLVGGVCIFLLVVNKWN